MTLTAQDFAGLPVGASRASCPVCDRGPRDRTLGVTIEPDGGGVFHCFRCGSAGAWRASGESRTRVAARPMPAPRALSATFRGSRAERVWTEARPITAGSVAAHYLEGRGCVLPPVDGDLRWTPCCYHRGSRREHPALIALVTDAVTREPLTIHRTYLRADGSGKADVDPPRLLWPGLAKKGGVIRLWPDEAVTTRLAIAEGIETALTAAHAFTPAWSCIDAGNLAQFPVLEAVESLLVIADHDDAGISAGTACAQRWADADREVFLWRSQCAGADLNDEVCEVAA